jgi:hypothetical protein
MTARLKSLQLATKASRPLRPAVLLNGTVFQAGVGLKVEEDDL